MVRRTGLGSSPFLNEQVADTSLPTDYYVAHLLLLPNDPGPEDVTPFYFVSTDLCAIVPYLQLILDTPPSQHGYTRRIHRHNYAAATFHRFSYFLIPCYARNFNRMYADALGRYLAKVVYVRTGVPLELLENVSQFDPPPVIIAENPECVERARKLHLPCFTIQDITPGQLNFEIQLQFSKPADPLPAAELERMKRGQFDRHVSPNVFIATAPEEYLWGESDLHPFPVSGVRVMLPNEALGNQLRRRYMPAPSRERPDPMLRMGRLLVSTSTIFAQRLSDFLVETAQFGSGEETAIPALRERVREYIKTVSPDSYEALLNEAGQNLAAYPPACSFILCCPAINKKSSQNIYRKTVPDRILRTIYKAEEKDFQMYVRREDFRSQEEFVQFQALGYYRAAENAFLSAVLSLYAISYHRPVIRTPQLASGLFGKLRSLRQTYAGRNQHAFVRDLRKFSVALMASLPQPVRDFLASTPFHELKLISDLPLEWLLIDDVPLMFRCLLSRLPLTPGNALFAHANVCREDLHVGPEEAKRVLICNCLSPDDPLFRFPKIQSETMKASGYPHTYVEVAGVKQFSAALQEHKPYILVHWGHGSYDRVNDREYLHIGDEKTEIWDLKDCCVPLIVLLAACETAAIAETHNNPANGWLSLGARSVLATYFPVQADLTTSIFTRIFSYLTEAVHGEQPLGTWAMIVSKTLILSRYLDFFYGFVDWLHRRGLPSPPGEVFFEYTFLWNQERGSLEEGYRRCPELLTLAIGRFSKELADKFQEYLRREAPVPHTMFFTHLGAPETIIIRKERRPDEDTSSESFAYWEMRASEERREPQ